MGTILITGANRGLGLEFTQQFAAAGHRILACCRNPDQAHELQELAAGGAITVAALDVADFSQIEALARRWAGETIDVLINNAGVYGKRTGLGDLDYEEWAQVFKINVQAPMKMAELFRQAVARGERKVIVNISSKMGSISDNSSGGAYVYRSSKAALNALTKSLAVDLAPLGILVVALHPGWVRTRMGGAGGLIDAQESVAGMKKIIDGLSPRQSGGFFNYDGREIPW